MRAIAIGEFIDRISEAVTAWCDRAANSTVEAVVKATGATMPAVPPAPASRLRTARFLATRA